MARRLSGGPDGYIDNVDVRVKAATSELMYLEVNTTIGQVRLRNQTGANVNFDYYEITSATNALNATAWNSLQDQNLAGFPIRKWLGERLGTSGRQQRRYR